MFSLQHSAHLVRLRLRVTKAILTNGLTGFTGMMLSDKRLEKELAAQKYRAEKLAKEALAQQKKAEAIAHLESQGQRVEGVVGFSKKLEAKTSDNTLALLLGRKAVSIATEGEKIKEQNAKVALIKQQEESRRSRELKNENENLPHPWTSVFDQNSKAYYYWNSITNETTWEKPQTIICDSTVPIIEDTVQSAAILPNQINLSVSTPTGWEEKVHPATQQKYYINPTTGERRSEAPTLEALTAIQINSSQIAAPEAKKRPSSSSSDEFSKFQRYAIDPLDVCL